MSFNNHVLQLKLTLLLCHGVILQYVMPRLVITYYALNRVQVLSPIKLLSFQWCFTFVSGLFLFFFFYIGVVCEFVVIYRL